MDGGAVALTGGQWGSGGTNYSAGNPRWDRLRMNGEKFKLAFAAPGGIGGSSALADRAQASYDTGAVSVGAFDYVGKAGLSGRARTVTYFQVAGVSPSTKKASVTGNYTAVGAGSVAGLVKDPGASAWTGAVVDGASVTTVPKSCLAIKTSSPASASGSYLIDPDGTGSNAPFSAYCDMSTDGGGWTLVGWNKGTSNAVGLTFFVSASNLSNAANKDSPATAASIGAETFSKQVGTTSAMLKSSAYSATPIIENGFGKWDYDVTKCSGTLNHTSRTGGCPGYNANDDWSTADRYNVAYGQEGIVPDWLATGHELCYSGHGWCDFEFYLR